MLDHIHADCSAVEIRRYRSHYIAIRTFFTDLTVISSNERTVDFDINGDGAITNLDVLWSVHLIRKNPPGVNVQEQIQVYLP